MTVLWTEFQKGFGGQRREFSTSLEIATGSETEITSNQEGIGVLKISFQTLAKKVDNLVEITSVVS